MKKIINKIRFKIIMWLLGGRPFMANVNIDLTGDK